MKSKYKFYLFLNNLKTIERGFLIVLILITIITILLLVLSIIFFQMKSYIQAVILSGTTAAAGYCTYLFYREVIE